MNTVNQSDILPNQKTKKNDINNDEKVTFNHDPLFTIDTKHTSNAKLNQNINNTDSDKQLVQSTTIPVIPSQTKDHYNPAPGQTSVLLEENMKQVEIIKPAYLNADDTAGSLLWRIFQVKTKNFFRKLSNFATKRTVRIGISARIFHPEAEAKGLRGKTLQYLEESLAHWVMSRDVIVFMIPTVAQKGSIHYNSNISLKDYAKHLDGLVLQGGADISPLSYGEKTTRPEWTGDQIRDLYELELCHNFIESGKPVLGICRGCQVINVAFGGSLYQDIATEHPNPVEHVHASYDLYHHPIEFIQNSYLGSLFNKSNKDKQWIVNSIHHQAIKTLGTDIVEEAISTQDSITEAIRYTKAPFVVGIQWHPEFHRHDTENILDCTPLLDQFLRTARETRF